LDDHALIRFVYETAAEDLSEVVWADSRMRWPVATLSSRFAVLQAPVMKGRPELSLEVCITEMYDGMQKRLRDSLISDAELRPL